MSESTTQTTSIPVGRYRHYKGNEYTVLGAARHSETSEELVVYRQEYGDRSLWTRPLRMFLETVLVEGRETPRFRRLESNDSGVARGATNLLAEIPWGSPSETCRTLIQSDAIRVERIVSHGHASPSDFWYDQSQREWVILLKGAAQLRFEDGLVEMKPGDSIDIPAHRKHRVEWTTPDEPTVWLAIHFERDTPCAPNR